jgi:hypothetical protein
MAVQAVTADTAVLAETAWQDRIVFSAGKPASKG